VSVRAKVETVATGVVMLCALLVTTLFVRRELMPQPDPRAPRPPEYRKEWRGYIGGRKLIGTSGAPITIVEFSDFQCPFCRQFALVIDSLLLKHPNQLQVVFRNFPLTGLHPHAKAAAVAAECAAAAGKFEGYHSALFSHQDSIGVTPWDSIADRVGITGHREFNTCVNTSPVLGALRDDSLAAVKLGVNGTPTVIVNGWLFAGTPSMDQVEAIIAKRGATK
jgi:protein-disulfide isomerase